MSAFLESLVLPVLTEATVAAAIAAASVRGRGDNDLADQLATEAMREVLNARLPCAAVVVAGEGGRTDSPRLEAGEELGHGDFNDPVLQLVVDPLEATRCCARGEPGSISMLAAAFEGEGAFHVGPDTYLEKVVLAADLAARLDVLRHQVEVQFPDQASQHLLDLPLSKVVDWLAWARQKERAHVTTMLLDRERNVLAIKFLQELNSQVRLIRDGDAVAALLALDRTSGVDLALGIGGAPEALIAAAVTRVFGGHAEFRWWDAASTGPKPIYTAEQLASGHVMFAMTGVTSNEVLRGVRYRRGLPVTDSICGSSRTGVISRIEREVHVR